MYRVAPDLSSQSRSQEVSRDPDKTGGLGSRLGKDPGGEQLQAEASWIMPLLETTCS